jgi:transcriptional regulator of heat shock response
MEDKLKKILACVVEDVIRTGEPVGSQYLVETYGLDVSPATIRNWFAELEELGLITHTHTSSGRVPTEKGYRLYADELMGRKPLAHKVAQDLEGHLNADGEPDQRLKAAAKFSAELMHGAVVLGLRENDSFYTGLSHLFAQPEFRHWGKVVDLSSVLDRLDEVLMRLRQERFSEPQLRIGSECPFGNACGTALVSLGGGALFGIIGPMRMDYRQAIAILNLMQKNVN